MKDINVIEDKAVAPEKKDGAHNVLSAFTFDRKHSVHFFCFDFFFSLTKFFKRSKVASQSYSKKQHFSNTLNSI